MKTVKPFLLKDVDHCLAKLQWGKFRSGNRYNEAVYLSMCKVSRKWELWRCL